MRCGQKGVKKPGASFFRTFFKPGF